MRLLPTCALAIGTAVSLAPAQAWLPAAPYPAWAGVTPQRTLHQRYDPSRTPLQNGADLLAAIHGLQPGDRLLIDPGTYSVAAWLSVRQPGTASRPVFIEAASSVRPVITRPDARRNCINIGSATVGCSHVALRNIEFTGGSDLIKIYEADNIWIDGCRIHDGNGVGIAANTADTRQIYVTHCEIERPGPGASGEGIYLGSNDASIISEYSVLAFNRVRDLRSGRSGDGIEIKDRSHHNWVVGNQIEDTRNPCILAYSTQGNGENVIEGNLCRGAADSVIQVQGDAIVRNNIAVGGGTAAFFSHNHRGTSRDLRVVHNTFISRGLCVRVQFDSGGGGFVFANNVAYSEAGRGIQFGTRPIQATIAGNVVVGAVAGATTGFVQGSGLGDFAGGSWDGATLNFTPSVGGRIDNRGAAAYAVAADLTGTNRTLPVDPGAIASAESLSASSTGFATTVGGRQILRFQGDARMAGERYLVLGSTDPRRAGATIPGGFELPFLLDSWSRFTLASPNNAVLQNTGLVLDGAGRARASIALPPLPSSLAGITFQHAFVVWDGNHPAYVSNPVPLSLR